jgi:hypothetical protein
MSEERCVVGIVEEAMAKVLVVGDTETVAVIPETVGEGEGTEAFMCGVAVEWVSPVSGADGVEVFGNGNIRSEGVEEKGVRVIRMTRKGIGEACFPRSPFDGVLITPDFFNP